MSSSVDNSGLNNPMGAVDAIDGQTRKKKAVEVIDDASAYEEQLNSQ